MTTTDADYAKRKYDYEHGIEELKNSYPYNSGAFEEMVKLYRSANPSGQANGELARQAAVQVLGQSGYYSLPAAAKNRLLSNITHGKIDTW